MKICIIDDDRNTANTISKFLQMEGHECVVIYDGRAGLDILEREDFDAVVLELSLPDFSGTDIIVKLEDTGRIKDHNICVYTASISGQRDYDYIKNTGVREIIKKPIDLAILLKYMEKIQKS